MKIIVLHSFKLRKTKKNRIWRSVFGRIRGGNFRTTVLLSLFSLMITTGFIIKVTNDNIKYDVRKASNKIQTLCKKNDGWKDVFQCRKGVHYSDKTLRKFWTEGHKNPCFRNQRKHPRDHSSELLQCVPYFFVIGFPKCGTTDLFDRMSHHPEFVQPSFKEIHWISRYRFIPPRNDRLKFIAMNKTYRTRDFDHGFLLYTRVFYPMVLDVELEKLLKNRTNIEYRKITGDFSPSTIWDNDIYSSLPRNFNLTIPMYTTADFVQEMNACAKLIVMIRDPVQRLYSDYLFFHAANKGPFDFHNKVTSAIKLYNDCINNKGVDACAFDAPLAKMAKVRLRLGIYVVYIKQWLRRFPMDQFLFVRLEDYAARTSSVLNNVFSFLQMGSVDTEIMGKMIFQKPVNTRKVNVGEMLPETQNILTDFYEPFNEQLAQLLNDHHYLYHLS
ncbi:carbohydrate sulfotransferase 15-like [Saccostrea echinata]|uniref:carbohydrate sulfotransferase 15-like n=1 Tax=Saccostrea echinata TaxID=191078 RepID=UPI002A83D262|nr:carbohydrate sulfotransferase 15-like [Saccostrea echinata]